MLQFFISALVIAILIAFSNAALWDGTSLNTTFLTNTWNQLWKDNMPVEIVRKHNGLLYKILGKKTKTPNGSFSFERMESVTGNKIEIQFLGKLDDIPTLALANEGDSATVTHADDYWGSVEFDFTHYNLTPGIKVSEWVQIQGKEVKGARFFKKRHRQIMLSLENTIGNGINSATAVSTYRTSIGTWRHAMSDGVSTGETTYATYGLNRADSANADIRGATTQTGVGAITVQKLQKSCLDIAANGGSLADFGICGADVYNYVWNAVTQYTHITQKGSMNEFEGMWVGFGNVDYLFDQRAAAGVLGHGTSEDWGFWKKDVDMFDKESMWVRDPSKKAMRVAPFDVYAQFLCSRPSGSQLLTGIDS